MNRYASMKNGRQFASPASASVTEPVSSYRLTIVTSEVSLNVLMKLFMIDGTTSRSACGRTILRCVCQ